MDKLFNVADRFSQSLDELRGPERKNHYLRKYRAWTRVSPARRTAAAGLGVGIIAGAISYFLYRRRGRLEQIGSRIKGRLGEVVSSKTLDKMAS